MVYMSNLENNTSFQKLKVELENVHNNGKVLIS